jgi:hypothetical protein
MYIMYSKKVRQKKGRIVTNMEHYKKGIQNLLLNTYVYMKI